MDKPNAIKEEDELFLRRALALARLCGWRLQYLSDRSRWEFTHNESRYTIRIHKPYQVKEKAEILHVIKHKVKIGETQKTRKA